MTRLLKLPVDDIVPQLVKTTLTHPCVLLRAPTGAGKTTRVPPAFLSQAELNGQILLLEPRRLAARSAARRIADERRTKLGQEIGYQVRFDKKISAQTRLQAITPGLLLRRFQADPFLEDTALIIFDEFHERSLDIDLCLSFSRLLQESVRPELKILLMSATLELESLSAALGEAPVVISEGRLHPIDIQYQSPRPQERLEQSVERVLLQVLKSCPGDVLVFLPGQREIRRCQRQLESLPTTPFDIHALHGQLSLKQQSEVLKASHRRKVILSTNIAESSLTIESVTAVIDSGLERRLMFHAGLGLNRLELARISKASADQRAGRAGRLQAGLCIRLWSQADQQGLPERRVPEIQRVELSAALLQCLSLGEGHWQELPWLDKPRESAMQQAEQHLRWLGALEDGRLTALGQELAKLPLDPRLGALLLRARQRPSAAPALALTVALLSERDPLQLQDPESLPASPSDLIDRLEALQRFEITKRTRCELGQLKKNAARQLLKSRDQLLRSLKIKPTATPSKELNDGHEEWVLRSLLTVFPDRLAKRRAPRSERAVMVGGRGVRLAPSSRVREHELFLCLDLDAGQTESLVRVASGVEASWLPEQHLSESVDYEFDADKQWVQARKRRRFLDLILDESPAPLSDAEATAEALKEAAKQQMENVWPGPKTDAYGFRQRWLFLAEQEPELDLPRLDEELTDKVLDMVCAGRRSFDELRRGPWLAALKGQLSYQQQQLIKTWAPSHFKVPSGRLAPIDYSGPRPVLAARTQELFGLKQTPSIAHGRIKVVLHILAPNYRPQQITDDLESFWANTYPQVRKDLRGRYPKHHWPENPAEAEYRPLRRRPRKKS